MKFHCLKLAAASLFAALCIPAGASVGHSLLAKRAADANPASFSMQLPSAKRGFEWKGALRQSPFARLGGNGGMLRAVEQGDLKIGPVSSFGELYAPDGSEWMYTASFEYGETGGYTAAHLKIYDERNNLVGTIDDTFELGEHQTGINSVMIDPNITQKFFNVDDKYEVILFIHATTDDYQGYTYQRVYTLGKDQTKPLLTVPGYEVLITDVATDQWSEKKQMVMLREELDYETGTYYLCYDIYDRASWGSLYAPVLLHTFKLDYSYIAGSGEMAYPLVLQKVNGVVWYAVAHYEKPFFDPSIPVYEEPVVTPDNTFIIDLYTAADFEKPFKTVRIPMVADEGYMFTFPAIGALMGNDDFAVGLFDDTETPYFVVAHDNYVNSTDDFKTSFYVYDLDGKRVKTIATDVTDYIRMHDVAGASIQFCMTNDEEERLEFYDLPSCEMVAQIPYVVDDRLISTAVDRVPSAGKYKYVIACANGELDIEDNVLHPIGYFNADGSLNHWDFVNLGSQVVMAQPAIISNWLNPYLYDTESDVDYTFLVKVPTETSKYDERLWVLNADGTKLADYGPSEEEGTLSAISVLNTNSANAQLSVVYYDWKTDKFVLHYNNLPFNKFSAGGKGTVNDPYLISSPGDLQQLATAPGAYYKLANDIDCEHYPIAGNKIEFSGVLDGDNHVIKNLTLRGSSLVGSMVGKAEVKNLTLESPIFYPETENAGIIASDARYDGESAPNINNVHVLNAAIAGESHSGIVGGIIGMLTTKASVTNCSLMEADINLPRAVVGGIVGETSVSGAIVNTALFTGKMTARTAGGIIGTSAVVELKDVHVNADITGTGRAGGVVGYLGDYNLTRGTFTNCYVEGTVTSTNAADANAGGLAGEVSEGDNVCLTNNIVALSAINYDANAKQTAHRVAGHTSADEPGQVLWEDPWWTTFTGDPYQHPELWPREPSKPDHGFNSNYAVETLAPVNGNAAMAKDASSVEGKSIAASELTQEFLSTSCGFNFGSDPAAPWVMTDGGLSLWFEKDLIAGISIAQASGKANSLRIKNGLISGNGAIEVYTVAGVKVASGRNALSIANLQPGIYVATSNGRSMKFIR